VPSIETASAYQEACNRAAKTLPLPVQPDEEPTASAASDASADDSSKEKKNESAPIPLVEALFEGGKEALAVKAKELLLSTSLPDIIKAHCQTVGSPFAPIGFPRFAASAAESEQPLECGKELTLTVTTDVWPSVKLGKYKGIQASYTKKPYEQKHADSALDELREQQVTTAIKEAKEGGAAVVAELGDAVKVLMKGYEGKQNEAGEWEKGEPLPQAASSEKVTIVMNPGKYLMQGLIEGLVGCEVNETRTVTVSFPQVQQATPDKQKEVDAKRVVFDVTVHQIDTRTLPELTDEFAAKFRPGMTMEILREEINKAVTAADTREATMARDKALEDAIVPVVEAVLPATLIESQAADNYDIMFSEMRSNGVPEEELKQMFEKKENFLKYMDIARPRIERELKMILAVDEIAKIENIKVTPEELAKRMQNLREEAAKSGVTEFNEEQYKMKLEANLQRAMVMEWLAEHADLKVLEEQEAVGVGKGAAAASE
jgi:trigger factor